MIRVNVDPTNPGQFFACCGLLELADRLWPASEGWFEKEYFFLHTNESVENATALSLFNQLKGCALGNTMTAQQITRLKELSAMKGSMRSKSPGLDEEKAFLEKLLREEPILLDAPFHLRLDWFRDNRAAGSRFKTWAGRQSVLEIASSMKNALSAPDWGAPALEDCLSRTVSGCGLPFNFDSDLGGQGSALDVGFSFDPLAGSTLTRIESGARPCLELLAFIGLQRFRPMQLRNENRFVYSTWNRPLTPEIAAPAACGMLPLAVHFGVRVPASISDEISKKFPSRHSLFWRSR